MSDRAGGDTTRTRAAIEAERAIPVWLRNATAEVREFHADLCDRHADQAEATASNLRRKAKALRVYNRRLALGMTVEGDTDGSR